MLNPGIFKAYDIRGTYPDQINEETVKQIVWGYIDLIKPQKVIIGLDARKSSPNLKTAVVDAFLLAGVDVLDLGFCSTPVFYFALTNRAADGGIMITASHNPAQYNGLKLCRAKAAAIDGETGGYEIRDRILTGQTKEKKSERPGQIKTTHITDEYIEKTLAKIDTGALGNIKVVADAGNGMAGKEIEKIFAEIPAGLTKLYFKIDGSFPNHEANPLKEETLQKLEETIIEKKASLGVAFDGDGDRISFLDERGKLIRGDFITALLARRLLRENPSQKVYFEVRSSKIVPETIAAAGGQPILGRPGHSVIKNAMRQQDILFGGELSGHYFFREFGFVENPVYALLLVLQILSQSDQKMSALIAPFARYQQSGEINFSVEDPPGVLGRVKQYYGDAQTKEIDGLTVIYPGWWFNLRQSNTEPLVRLNLEADTPTLLQEKLTEVKKIING